MRITVKTKQDRNSKESRYQKIFEKKLKKLLLKHYGYRASNEDYINQTIDGFEVFDPVLDWDYKPLCGCEVSGFDLINNNIKQNRLFERNAHLLYYTTTSRRSLMSEIVEGYEMWVLENMDIVFTYFVQMKVPTEESIEKLTYRYALGKKIPDEMYMSLRGLLGWIEDDVYGARSRVSDSTALPL